MTVLQIPLDAYGSPGEEERSAGRFIARAPGYADKEIYEKGRLITIAAEIAGKQTQPLDEIQYTYPVVEVKEMHLWKPAAHYREPYVYDHWYMHGYDYPYYLPSIRYHMFWHHRL